MRLGSRLSLPIALTILGLLLTVDVPPCLANTFACCLPDGSCAEHLLLTCDDLDGVSFVGRSCMDVACRAGAPLLSPPGLVALITAITAVALYALRRRTAA